MSSWVDEHDTVYSTTAVSVSVDSRVIVRDCQRVLDHIVWCMEMIGCTDYALRRGDLHSGTLRDGNHKPTIPSAGALGLKLECTSECGGIWGVYGRVGSEKFRMGI